jgi:urease accessory protein
MLDFASLAAQPRAEGWLSLSSKLRDARAVIDKLHQKGSSKVLFPRTTGPHMTGVLLNTAGGVTGGDRFHVSAEAGADTHLILTTQAAERAYRAQPGETGRLNNSVTVAAGARVDWLPQETILYDGADLNRRLSLNIAASSKVLVVEPVIFGRIAMKETVNALRFEDRVDLTRDGVPVFADRTRINGDAATLLERPTIGAGSCAMANVLFAAPDAARFLDPARKMMPQTGGVSLIRDGVLFARIMAPDGFDLRTFLLPLIQLLSVTPLPRTWMI